MTNSHDENYSGRSNASIAVSKARENKYRAQRPGPTHSVEKSRRNGWCTGWRHRPLVRELPRREKVSLLIVRSTFELVDGATCEVTGWARDLPHCRFGSGATLTRILADYIALQLPDHLCLSCDNPID